MEIPKSSTETIIQALQILAEIEDDLTASACLLEAAQRLGELNKTIPLQNIQHQKYKDFNDWFLAQNRNN